MCFPCVQVLPPFKSEVREGKWSTLAFPSNTFYRFADRLPSICVPSVFASDLPVGMEIAVYSFHEPDLFRLGYAFEQITRHRGPPGSTLA